MTLLISICQEYFKLQNDFQMMSPNEFQCLETSLSLISRLTSIITLVRMLKEFITSLVIPQNQSIQSNHFESQVTRTMNGLKKGLKF